MGGGADDHGKLLIINEIRISIRAKSPFSGILIRAKGHALMKNLYGIYNGNGQAMEIRPAASSGEEVVLPNYLNRIPAEHWIGRDNRHLLLNALSSQDAVKGVAVVQGKLLDP